MKRPLALLGSIMMLTACGTFRAYDGPVLGPDERSTVRGDPSVSAGLPVKVILRKVGERTVPVGRTTVAVAPGRHVLVVDCRVAEAGTSTRFVVEHEFEAGVDYRLEAEATTRGCDAVRLAPR